MKSLLTLGIFFIFIFELLASKGETSFKETFWYNRISNKIFVVKTYEEGMDIRGVHSNNRWTWFRRNSKTMYADRFGNKIKIFNDKLVYTSYDLTQRLIFFPCHYNHEDPFRYTEFDKTSILDNNIKSDHYFQAKENISDINRKNLSIDKIEGTWKVEGMNRDVYITETRQGIKARFIDDSRWYIYSFDSNLNTYISSDGHKYVLKDGQLTWIDKHLNKKFYLYKVSDELKD